MYGLTSAAFNGFFGIYVKEIGFLESDVGTILSLRRFSVGILSFLIVYIASKIGHKKTLIAGLLIVGISSIAIVATTSLPFMKCIAVLFGLGQAAILTIETPFIYGQSEEHERIHAYSLAFASRNAAFMIGSLATGLIADVLLPYTGAEGLNIRYALIFISLVSLLAIFPLIALKPKTITTITTFKYKEMLAFFNKNNILFIIYTGLIGLGAGMVVPFFGVYLKYVLDTSESIVGLILSFAQFGTVLGGLSVPFISKRLGQIKSIIITQLLSIPLLLIIGFPQGIVIVAFAFFFRSSLMNMGQPLIRSISMDIVTLSQQSLMSSMRAMINNLSRALGILIGGFIMTNYSYNTPYILTIACYLCGTWLFYYIFKHKLSKKSINVQ